MPAYRKLFTETWVRRGRAKKESISGAKQ